jgi:hypothetical protein
MLVGQEMKAGMPDTQQMIPLTDFAKAMRANADDSFAARVDEYESQFGKTDEDTLAVLAQAAYYCWGNYHFKDNLLQVCAAIGSGKPTSMYLHGQVAPCRWAELNSYVVAVQLWLDPVSSEMRDCVDARTVDMIAGWLADSTDDKRLLAAIFLNELVPNLVSMNLSKLGNADYYDAEDYHNFAHWYMRPDGTIFGQAREKFTDHCIHDMSTEARFNDTIGQIIASMVREKPHSCMHRFARHLDIQLSSIGMQKWRGKLPQCKALSKTSWIRFIEQDCGVRSWLAGESATNDYAVAVHASLGVPTDQKRAIVEGFLCAPDRGSVFAAEWIGEQSKNRGRTARQLFRIDET